VPEFRPVREDEIVRVADLYNNAYRVGLAAARSWVQDLPVDDTLAVVEPGRIASIVRIIPYTIWVGGKDLRMGGIGGVATWADCQGKGYAGRLMRQSVAVMRERGEIVSALYPFSHRYYRKFGWETAGQRLFLSEFTQADVHRYEERDWVRACLDDADFESVQKVYQSYASGYNGMVVRDSDNWKRRLKGLSDAGGQAYLIEHDGKPLGYFFCVNRATAPGANESQTHEFACLSHEAYRALFGFLSALPTNVKSISLAAPGIPSLLDHFKEPFVSIRCQQTFQFRIVDVQKGLAERGYDLDLAGRLTLSLRDECGDWNNGTWTLDFEQGRCEVRKAPSGDADVQMTIQDLSRLFIGAVDPVVQARHGAYQGATLKSLKLLRDAFHDRTPYLADAF